MGLQFTETVNSISTIKRYIFIVYIFKWVELLYTNTTTLPMSVIGQINIIKTFCLFQSFPWPLTESFSKEIHSVLCRFIILTAGSLQVDPEYCFCNFKWVDYRCRVYNGITGLLIYEVLCFMWLHILPTWVYIERSSISKLPLNLHLHSADYKATTKNN